MPEFDPPLGLPRVHAECDYLHPLRFEDEIEIEMLVTEKKSEVAQLPVSLPQTERPPADRSGAGQTDGRLRGAWGGRQAEVGAPAIPKHVADLD
jgi:hypothetical protein